VTHRGGWEVKTLPKVDTKCTSPSLIPTVNGNTVRSFPTHGQQSAAKGSSTTVSTTCVIEPAYPVQFPTASPRGE
jgi:hypothetical protein